MAEIASFQVLVDQQRDVEIIDNAEALLGLAADAAAPIGPADFPQLIDSIKAEAELVRRALKPIKVDTIVKYKANQMSRGKSGGRQLVAWQALMLPRDNVKQEGAGLFFSVTAVLWSGVATGETGGRDNLPLARYGHPVIDARNKLGENAQLDLPGLSPPILLCVARFAQINTALRNGVDPLQVTL